MELTFSGTVEEFQQLFAHVGDTSVFAKLDQILANQGVSLVNEQQTLEKIQGLQDDLTAAGVLIEKIGTETTGLLANATALAQQIADLQAQIGGTSPAIDAALDAAAARARALVVGATAVDNLVPDAPPAP